MKIKEIREPKEKGIGFVKWFIEKNGKNYWSIIGLYVYVSVGLLVFC